jgi:AraC-like DNA-binding protein
MNHRYEQRYSANQSELIERLSKLMPDNGHQEIAPGVLLSRASTPSERLYGVSRPSFCVIGQGAKEVYAGESIYRYDAEKFLIATVELPIIARVVEASIGKPYLAMRLNLDHSVVSSLMVESGTPIPPASESAKAISVSSLDSELLDATVRFVRLLESPGDANILGAAVRREITFRLLQGEQGQRLQQLPALGNHSNRIARAIHHLRKEYNRPLSIEALAKDLGMSSSGFHHHFKAVTELSPLQYQKQLRLQEARRLLLNDSLDVSKAGFQVGYDNPSHFSRDYKKHFGKAPLHDVESIRSSIASGS